jgi:hypothetical protein
MWIVIVGNPLDGLAFHGPFEYSDSAVDWAETYAVNWAEIYAVDLDWWVSEVAPV